MTGDGHSAQKRAAGSVKWADLGRRFGSAVVLVILATILVLSSGLWLRFGISIVAGLLMWELARLTGWRHPEYHSPRHPELIGFLGGLTALAMLTLPGDWPMALVLVPVLAGLPGTNRHERVAYVAFTIAILVAAYAFVVIHEVMGRACGYLTAQAAEYYQTWHSQQEWLPGIGHRAERWDIHAVYLPELKLDIEAEAERLKVVMDEAGCVNVFLSEGAGIPEIVAEMQARGEEPEKDPFGHVKIDTINPGQWFAKQFASRLGAEKVMVQKSGYFARSAKANPEDIRLIKSMTDYAVQVALEGGSGLIGHDEERGDVLRAVEFERVAGHKAFDISQPWFHDVMERTGQKIVAAEKH